MAKKFIINDNRIILSASVDFHAELHADCANKQATIGGGWWFADDERKVVFFYSVSTDFGGVTKEEFLKAYEESWWMQAQWEHYDVFFSYHHSLPQVVKEYNSLIKPIQNESKIA